MEKIQLVTDVRPHYISSHYSANLRYKENQVFYNDYDQPATTLIDYIRHLKCENDIKMSSTSTKEKTPKLVKSVSH